MVTKGIKSPGNIQGQSKQYWENAAKQFVWPINFTDLQILVPEKDLQMAEDDLMVKHFRAAGWHVQSVIGGVDYNKIYEKPTFNTKFKKIIKPNTPLEKQSLYNIGNKFKVKSTECELEITHIEKGKIHLKYLNRDKHDILSSEENLTRVISLKQWIPL